MNKLLRNLALMAFVSLGGFFILAAIPRHVAATSDVMITNEVPMNGSVTNVSTSANARAYFIVGTGNSGQNTDNKYAYAKIYLPINSATGKNYQSTVTINWGAGICNGGPSAQPLDAGSPNVDYNLQDMSDTESLTGGNSLGYFATVNSMAAGSTCANTALTVPADSALASTITGHTAFAVLYFEAVINNTPSSSTNKSFWVTAASTTGNAYASISRPVKNYGLGGAVSHDQSYFAVTINPSSFVGFNYGLQISPRCGEYQTTTAIPSSAIGMYDADNSTNNSLQYTVQAVIKYDATATTTAWPAPLLTVAASGLGGNNVVNTTSMGFNAYNNNRYKLSYNNFKSSQTLQAKVPFDQFDSINNCYKMTCTAQYAPSTIRPGVPLLVTITATNAGTVSWPDTQLLYGGTSYTMAQPPSAPPINPGENATYKITINNNVIGGPYTVNYYMFSGSGGGCNVTYMVADVPVSTVDANCKRINAYVWFPNALSTNTHSQMYMEDITPQTAYNTPPITSSFNTGSSTETSPIILEQGVYNPATADLSGTTPTGGQWFSFDVFHTSYNHPSNPMEGIYAYPTGHGISFSSYNLIAWHTYRFTIMGQDKAGSPTLVPLSLPGGGLAQATIGPCMDFSCTMETSPGTPAIGDTVTFTFHPVINNRTNNYFNDNIGGSGYNIYSLHIRTTGLSGVVLNPPSGDYYNPSDYTVGANAGVNAYGSGTPPGITMTATVASLPYSALLNIGFGNGFGNIPAGTSAKTGCVKAAIGYNKPYIKVFSGDTSAGGGFNAGVGPNNCGPGNPSGYFNSSDIKAYADSSTTGTTGKIARRVGSSTDFAAFALGIISGDSSKDQGFYSGLPYGTLTSGGTDLYSPNITYSLNNPLTFGNSSDVESAVSWGGGANITHCIPDWYSGYTSGLSIDTSSPSAPSYDLNQAADNVAGSDNRIGIWGDTGIKILDGTVADTPAGIASSQVVIRNKRTVVVLGNVHLQTNIVNDPNWHWTAASPSPPQLTLIVKGNIYIDPQVTRLDGLIISQYRNSTQSGDIYTCGIAYRSATATEIPGTCNTELSVNGSLVSQRVHFNRSSGSITDAAAASGAENASSNAAAEAIIFNPLLDLGSAFLSNSASSFSYTVDSNLNLPPVL